MTERMSKWTRSAAIALHHIAKIHETVFHMDEKAYKLHLDTVRLGLSLTTEAVDESSIPVGTLATKSWYMASLKFVQKVRQKRETEEARKKSEELKTIQPELDAVKAANAGGMLALIRWLYEHQKPHNGKPCNVPDDVKENEQVTKKHLLLVIKDYSPSPFTSDPSMRKLELLYTEIQKLLNFYYELNFKNAADGSQASEDGGKQEA